MSADNWAICPRCKKNKQLTGIDEYTLREDYEIGIQDGEFYARYKGRCNSCDFDFRYDYSKKVE